MLPLSSEAAVRARAFARASHRALAPVLCVRPDEDAIWVEAISGLPATALDPRELAELRGALAALHRAGGRHGAVDAAHVIRRGGETLLAFPLAPNDAVPDADFVNLDALAGV